MLAQATSTTPTQPYAPTTLPTAPTTKAPTTNAPTTHTPTTHTATTYVRNPLLTPCTASSRASRRILPLHARPIPCSITALLSGDTLAHECTALHLQLQLHTCCDMLSYMDAWSSQPARPCLSTL